MWLFCLLSAPTEKLAARGLAGLGQTTARDGPSQQCAASRRPVCWGSIPGPGTATFRIPMGTSLWGLRVSSAVVATMSKPMQHERDHEQHKEALVEPRRRSVEPRR